MTMPSGKQHRIYRNPALPWAELRVSVNTSDCYRAHAHAEYSIGVVDHGRATFHHPAGPQRVQAGSVVLIEPHVVHSCNPMPGELWSYRMLFVNAAWLQGAVARVWGLEEVPNRLAFISRCIEDSAAHDQVHQFCQSLDAPSKASSLDSDMPAWVASVCRAGNAQDSGQVPAKLVPALAAMHNEYGRKLTVGALAEICDMRSSQFIRQFNEALGMTPGNYLRNLRINGARRLLSQGVALAEVALTMGFSDQAHMQRAFKAHHAMTPGNYRKDTKPG